MRDWRPATEFAGELARSNSADPQTRMQDLDMRIWLEGDPLTKVDRMSMAASLEARVPFLELLARDVGA